MKQTTLDSLIVIGDKVLVRPRTAQERTRSGLYLPPGVQEREQIQYGYVLKVGPGYPIPAVQEIEEPWKDSSEEVRYVPLQPKPGDLALYLQKCAYEIEFENEKYMIVPHAALLLLVRDEELFE